MPNHEARRRRWRRLWLPYVSGAFGLGISAQISFLVPLRAIELGAGLDFVGIVVGAGALAGALTALPVGSTIDRVGPRRAFMVGTAISCGLLIAYTLVTDYRWFLVLQPLLGVARNLAWVASQTYVTGIRATSDRTKDVGYFSMFTNIGQMVGPVIVGVVAQAYGYRLALLVPALYAFVFMLVVSATPDLPRAEAQAASSAARTSLRTAIEIVALRGVRLALVLTFARLWISHVYTTFVPVYLVEQGIPVVQVGWVIAASGVVAAIVSPAAGLVSRKFGAASAATGGLLFGTAGLLVVRHVASVPAAYIVPVLVGIGSGLSLPLLLSIITAAVPPGDRGVALGLRGMANQAAGAVAPMAVGSLMAVVGMATGFSTAGIVALLLLVALRYVPGRRAEPRARAGSDGESGGLRE